MGTVPSSSGHDGSDLSSLDTMQSMDRDELSIDKMDKADQLDGNLETNPEDEHLAHSVVDVDVDSIDEGMVVEEAFNNNMGSFMPDMMFKDLVNNFKNAKKLYGETIIRELSGYDPRYIDKNVNIPEFQRELQKRLQDKADDLQDKGIMKANGTFTKDALNLAALFMIREEFDATQGPSSTFGHHVQKANDAHGDKSTVRPYRKGDAYKNLAAKQSAKLAIRRGHTSLNSLDLVSYDRESRQEINIVYALDTSGSMKGEKIRLAKRAGVSLAHRAIRDNNKVGLVLFGSTIEKRVPLTKDFYSFVRPMITSFPGNETDIALAIKSALYQLKNAKGIKHIVILTDGLHTTSKSPKSTVLEQVMIAKEDDVTISLVGISLDETGLVLAREIVDIANGRLYAVADVADVGAIIIGDYDSLL